MAIPKISFLFLHVLVFVLIGCDENKTLNPVRGRWEVLPGTNGKILTMLAHEDGIIFGGTFTAGELTSKKYMGFYNTKTLSFEPLFNKIESYNILTPGIHCLEETGNDLLIGGTFSEINSETVQHIAKYNFSTKTISQLGGGIPDEPGYLDVIVRNVVVSDNNIIVGGDFKVQSCNFLQRFDTKDQQWKCIPIGSSSADNGGVTTLALNSTDLFASTNKYVSRFDLLTLSEKVIGSIGPIYNNYSYLGYINSMILVGDNLYVGGYFSSVGNLVADCIAVYNPTSQTWSSLHDLKSYDPNFSVEGLFSDGDKLYVSGNFENTSLNKLGILGIASYDLKRERWEALGAGISGAVFSMVIKDNYLYVGGEFDAVEGKPATGFARYKLK